LAWIDLVFLFAVSNIMLFSTTLVAHFMAFRTALLRYWLESVLQGSALYLSWTRAKGERDDIAQLRERLQERSR
jgi:uncharacterized membrane protein